MQHLASSIENMHYACPNLAGTMHWLTFIYLLHHSYGQSHIPGIIGNYFGMLFLVDIEEFMIHHLSPHSLATMLLCNNKNDFDDCIARQHPVVHVEVQKENTRKRKSNMQDPSKHIK